MAQRVITEKELVLPGLYAIWRKPDGRISTSDLIKALEEVLKPSGRDAAILAGRSDSYFSQKVRNLKSHDTFEKRGYAKYRDGEFWITPLGRKVVEDNREALEVLFSGEFPIADVRSPLKRIYDNPDSNPVPYDELVAEGSPLTVTTKRYERSQRLRDAAVKHFTMNGHLACACCGFEFEPVYGSELKSCIEIHHIRPIFSYESEGLDEEKTIAEALKNLLPVCPNCHRVIHKNHITADMIEDFISRVHRR